MNKKFKLRVPEGYDLDLEFIEIPQDTPVAQNEGEAVPIETDEAGNLTWNGCGCGGK